MVPRLVQHMPFAFKDTERAGQNRRAIFADFPPRSGEAIFAFSREQVGHRLLANLQYVDREVIDPAQHLCTARIVGDAHKQQWGVERHAGEAVRRQANGPSVGRMGSDDGHPGCKAAHGITQGARIMVCGGRDMAAGVSEALTGILAPAGLTPAMLRAEGRYLEDVY